MTVNVDASRCIGCGMCAAAVPAGAFAAANGCPVNAIRARKA